MTGEGWSSYQLVYRCIHGKYGCFCSSVAHPYPVCAVQLENDAVCALQERSGGLWHHLHGRAAPQGASFECTYIPSLFVSGMHGHSSQHKGPFYSAVSSFDMGGCGPSRFRCRKNLPGGSCTTSHLRTSARSAQRCMRCTSGRRRGTFQCCRARRQTAWPPRRRRPR